MINNELEKALNELKRIQSGGEVDDATIIAEQEHQLETLEDECVDAKAIITITRNNMVAKLTIKPPSKFGKPISLSRVERALAAQGVVTGINKEYINRLVNFSVYDKSFIVAEGQPAIKGTDEYIEFLIDVKDNLTPTILEDGSTDYKNLGYHKSVTPNQKLGIIHPATAGQVGFDVLGNETPTIDGKSLNKSPLGTNTMLDKDKVSILATTSGNVFFKKNKIDVRHEKVVRNVDASTGNINFDGDVKVLNDVFEGFEVKCNGNIKVAGVVENALLIASGDIIVAKGIHGENCKVYAEGGIRSVHIESANLQCKGSIYADYVLNANIISDDEIHLEGEHGYIIGGTTIATNKIEADIIGNDTNMFTSVELLKSHKVDPEVVKLNEKTVHYTIEIDKLNRASKNIAKLDMSIEERQQYIERIITLTNKYNTKLEKVATKIDELEIKKANEEVEPFIVVNEKIFRNVQIKINGIETKTKKSQTKCNIITDQGKIEFVNQQLISTEK